MSQSRADAERPEAEGAQRGYVYNRRNGSSGERRLFNVAALSRR